MRTKSDTPGASLYGKAAVAGAVVGGLLTGGTEMAAAASPDEWRSIHYAVGPSNVSGYTDCGVNHGAIVRGWQSILWVSGYFGSTGEIDGGFGRRSADATAAYQHDHKLEGDGCAGYFTYGVAWYHDGFAHIGNVPGIDCGVQIWRYANGERVVDWSYCTGLTNKAAWGFNSPADGSFHTTVTRATVGDPHCVWPMEDGTINSDGCQK